ncbi:SRPBCC family protein [Agrococcus sediminis]|uniref:SRPBCC family protein n=1 Tax=Agrococcus sediminis TaxID=2599924 RepID=UPI00342C508C
MRSRYRFDHDWHLDTGADAVLALLEDVPGYGRWWPGVRVLDAAPAARARAADLEVRAPAGYRIRISIAEEARADDELRASIRGDLDGWSAWRVRPEGVGTRVAFAQEVDARKPLLRLASPVLHRVLAAQHAAVMRRAEQGMRAALELD